MKEISNKILSFLNKNYRFKISHTPFSSKTKGFIIKLFSLFVQAENLFMKTKIQKVSIHDHKPANSHIPENIRKMISKKKIQTDYLFTILERSFKISFFHFEPFNESIIRQQIKKMFMWLYTTSHFSRSKCSQTMSINVYFTSAKKNFPEEKLAPIDREHANTAFTTSCSTETEINIFREEEWFKVFIHESFHCMGLDFSEIRDTTPDALILNLFHIKTDVRLYETYCETWAEIVNVMFISYVSTRNNDIDKMIEKTEKMLYHERRFSLFQCIKVLGHFNLTYDNLIHRNKNVSVNYKEKTQILSYYILKCIYIFYVNDFVEWCLLNNGSTLDFNKSKERFNVTLKSYAGFIQSHYASPEFLTAITSFNERTSINDTEIKNTLRMSLFEIL